MKGCAITDMLRNHHIIISFENAGNLKILDVLTRSVTLLGSSVRTGRSSSHLSKITLSTRSISLCLFTLTRTDNVKSLSQT